jgi:hypothetical protein
MMQEILLGFVCFAAGAFFAIAVGIIALGRSPLEGPSDHTRSVNDPLPVEPTQQPLSEPERRPWRGEPEPHPAWPECDCPSEAFHFKYYPTAGVKS